MCIAIISIYWPITSMYTTRRPTADCSADCRLLAACHYLLMLRVAVTVTHAALSPLEIGQGTPDKLRSTQWGDCIRPVDVFPLLAHNQATAGVTQNISYSKKDGAYTRGLSSITFTLAQGRIQE